MHQGTRKVLFLTSALLLAAGIIMSAARKAPADELHITIGPRVLREPIVQPDARIIRVLPDDSQEARERRAEWHRVCEPRIWVGPDGVGRYVYGPNCPNGYIINTWLEVPND